MLADALRAALRLVPASVAIVTTGSGEDALGVTATAVTSVSLDPPALLVCVNNSLRVNAAIRANGRFRISYLHRGQEDIARAFGGPLSGSNRFRIGDWDMKAPDGVCLPSALLGVSCRLEDTHQCGTHSIFIGHVEAVRRGGGTPLLYCNGAYAGIGASDDV